MSRIILLLILIVLISPILLLPSVAIADVAQPDDSLVLEDIRAYQNVLEDNDQFYLIQFDMGYDTNPTGYDVSELFVVRLLDDTDAEIYSTSPYPFYNDGFDYGVVGMYFTAAEVLSLGMTFGDASDYTVQIAGNPTVSWENDNIPSVQTKNFDQWYIGSVSQAIVTNKMRLTAQKVETEWGGVYDLLEGSAGEQVLSYDGESYFTNCIPDLLILCPDIFAYTRENPILAPKTVVTDSYIAGNDNTYLPVYSGTWAFQTFTARDVYTINTLELELCRVGTPNTDLSIAICDEAGNVPDITPLYTSGTITMEEVSTNANGVWTEVSFGDGYDLEPQTEYAIVVYTSGGSSAAQYRWRGLSTGHYAHGNAGYSHDDGVHFTANAYDMNFIVGAEDASNMSFNQKQAHLLDGTIWDMSDLSDSLGISTMWLRSTVWMIMTFTVCVFAAQGAKSTKSILLWFLVMMTIGAPFGFVYWYISAFALFMCVIVVVYSLTWEKSSY